MKVVANSIESLFRGAGKFEELIRQLDYLISSTLPDQERSLFTGPSITMVGYGKMDWQNKKGAGIWPLISMAPQKNSVNIYVAADRDDTPLPQVYKDSLGKVSLGKNCIRITKIENINHDSFQELLRESESWLNLKIEKYGRACASPLKD